MTPLPANLPAVGSATLPAAYENAKNALSTCERIDECKDWADKAAALASYARQSEDESLQHFATRIRARAIRRCGELLAEIRPAPGANTPRPDRGGISPIPSTSIPTRAQAARDAGLSDDQRKTALRVASLSEDEFEAAVEAPRPATVTELAERGTRPAPPKPRPLVDIGDRAPADFTISTEGQGEIRRIAEFASRVRPGVVVRGAYEHELAALARNANTALAWLSELIAELENDDEQY